MDPVRKGAIAYQLLQHILLKKGAHLNANIVRELGNVAKETGIPLDDLRDFAKTFMNEAVESAFATKELSDDQGGA